MKKPKQWVDVYPYGTKEGDDEQKFWTTITRDPQRRYMSASYIARRTGLSIKTIETIIEKYATMSPPLLYPDPECEDEWGYWERCEDRCKTDDRSIAEKDRDRRIEKYLNE